MDRERFGPAVMGVPKGLVVLEVDPAVEVPGIGRDGGCAAKLESARDWIEDGEATAEADGGSSARDQRLRLASERMDRERFGPWRVRREARIGP
jgi:hypothetical protein